MNLLGSSGGCPTSCCISKITVLSNSDETNNELCSRDRNPETKAMVLTSHGVILALDSIHAMS